MQTDAAIPSSLAAALYQRVCSAIAGERPQREDGSVSPVSRYLEPARWPSRATGWRPVCTASRCCSRGAATAGCAPT